MKEPTPSKIVETVLGFDRKFCFMNYVNPDKPERLRMDLSERSELVFRLRDDLIEDGWKFQRRPIEIENDYGVNFSSYVWVPYSVGGETYERVQFKIIYECAREGEYIYSLLMVDPHGQKIDLDPNIENGAGRIP